MPRLEAEFPVCLDAVRLRGADGVDIWAKRFDTPDGDNDLLSVAVHAGDVNAVGRTSGTLEGQASAGDKVTIGGLSNGQFSVSFPRLVLGCINGDFYE